MKPFPDSPRGAAWLTAALAAIVISGCGQRGPLYLPSQPPQPTAPAAKPAPAKSAPAAADSTSSTSK